MSEFEAAYDVLRTRCASERNVSALDAFLEKHRSELAAPPSPKDRARVQTITQLLACYDSPTVGEALRELAAKYVPHLIVDDKLFHAVFKAIGAESNVAPRATKTRSDHADGTSNELCLHDMLELVYQALLTVIPDTSRLIIDWFDTVVAPTCCFQHCSEEDRALGVLVTIQFLNIHQDFRLENEAYSFFKDPDALKKLHSTIVDSDASISPAILLVWGLVLHNVALRYMESPSKPMGAFLVHVGVKDSDNLDYTARGILSKALDAKALSYLVAFVNLLPRDVQYTQTATDVFQAIVAITFMSEPLAASLAVLLGPFPVLAREFFEDPCATTALELSKAKVPAALRSFILLARAYPDALGLLTTMSCFIDRLPDPAMVHIQGRDVTASTSITVFPARPTDGQGSVVLQPGTSGTLLSEPTAGLMLVMWPFQYNGWSLLGRVLENSYLYSTWGQTSNDIVLLIAHTLRDLDLEDVDKLLGALSAGLARGDIIDLLSDCLDFSMASYSHVPTCLAIIQFYTRLTATFPERVWARVSRSRLLDQNGDGGFMSSVVGAVEILSGKFDFTFEIISFIRSLVENLDTHSLLQQETITKFLRHLVDVLASFSYWAYAKREQKQQIFLGIVEVLSLVVEIPACKVADALISELLSPSEARQRTIQPFVDLIDELSVTNTLNCAQAMPVLRFCATLLRIRSDRQMAYSFLERQLYLHSPQLVDIYGRHFELHSSLLELLCAMVGAESSEQVSLLAHLGTSKSALLLSSLTSTTENNLEQDETVINVCNFFSTVASSKQEGLFALLNKGKDPRTKVKGANDKGEEVKESLFMAMQQKVTRSGELISAKVLAALLCAISIATNVGEGPPADEVEDLNTDLVRLVKYAFENELEESVVSDYNLLAAAKSVDILSSRYFRRQPKDVSPQIQEFVSYLAKDSNLQNYTQKFLFITGFKAPLHASLSKFLHHKNGELSATYTHPIFLSTPVLKTLPVYGDNFFYDVKSLGIALRNDDDWYTKEKSLVESANANLSFVDAQSRLLYYWKTWCVALVAREASTLSSQLSSMALLALSINLRANLAVPYFEHCVKLRVDLTFYTLYRLRQADKLKFEVGMVKSAFELLSDPNIGIGACAAEISAPRIYQQLLKIINLELALLSDGVRRKLSMEETQIIVRLLDHVGIQSVRPISSAAAVCPSAAAEDLVEVIMILRQSLAVVGPSSPQLNFLAQTMMDSGSDRAITRLYSYALDIEPETPLLGELALLYILEWLPVGFMADNFVSKGLMTALLEAPLSLIIQRGGIIPSTHPRIHATWRRGLLPILFAVVQHLGARIVPEAWLFLERFDAQIDTCLSQWVSPNGQVSVALIEETFLLNVLLLFLSSFATTDHCGSSPKLLDRDELLKAIDHLSSHRKYLTTRVFESNFWRGSWDDLVDRIVTEMADLRNVVELRSQ